MKIALIGAGLQAQAIAHDLARSSDLKDLVIADRELKHARALVRRVKKLVPDSRVKLRAREVDATKLRAVAEVIGGAACVIGSTTYAHNLGLTRAAIRAKSSFVDLGGNVDVVKAQHELSPRAEKAGVTVIPDCGLAPGLVNVLGYHWATQLDRCDELRIRVGGLPQTPTTRLGYQLLFSVEGLINEYVEDCQVLRDGRLETVPGLSGHEKLSFKAPYDELEAFYTSGGASTLPSTLAGRVDQLDYKTIRYRGHHRQVALMHELGLFSSRAVQLGRGSVVPRRLTARLLTDYLPRDQPDVALIRIRVVGVKGSRRVWMEYDAVDRFDPTTGLTAMQRCTGYPAAIIALMLARGEIAARGTVPQELAIPAEPFLIALNQRGIAFVRRNQRA